MWIELGGDEPYRYRGEVIASSTGRAKCVMDNGRPRKLMKLHAGLDVPVFRPTTMGRLRFKPMNRFEVRIPAIGHYKRRTFQDVVLITDQMLTANLAAYERNLPTTEHLSGLVQVHPHASRARPRDPKGLHSRGAPGVRR